MVQEMQDNVMKHLVTQLVDILLAGDRLEYLKFNHTVSRVHGKDNFNTIQHKAFDYLEITKDCGVFGNDG